MAKTEHEKAAEKVGAEVLGVYNKTGNLVREYSAEVHGEGFDKKAKEYAGKIGGKVDKIR